MIDATGILARAFLTHPQSISDEREAEEPEKHHVPFVEASEDAAIAFQSTEQSFDFISSLVQGPVVLPWFDPVGFRRNHRNDPLPEVMPA
jgi:hypothetical protein